MEPGPGCGPPTDRSSSRVLRRASFSFIGKSLPRVVVLQTCFYKMCGPKSTSSCSRVLRPPTPSITIVKSSRFTSGAGVPGDYWSKGGA